MLIRLPPVVQKEPMVIKPMATPMGVPIIKIAINRINRTTAIVHTLLSYMFSSSVSSTGSGRPTKGTISPTITPRISVTSSYIIRMQPTMGAL